MDALPVALPAWHSATLFGYNSLIGHSLTAATDPCFSPSTASTALARPRRCGCFTNGSLTTGHEVVTCRDPGSTSLGRTGSRNRSQERPHHAHFPRSEMLLYMAARAQLVDEVIRPAIDCRQGRDLRSLSAGQHRVPGVRGGRRHCPKSAKWAELPPAGIDARLRVPARHVPPASPRADGAGPGPHRATGRRIPREAAGGLPRRSPADGEFRPCDRCRTAHRLDPSRIALNCKSSDLRKRATRRRLPPVRRPCCYISCRLPLTCLQNRLKIFWHLRLGIVRPIARARASPSRYYSLLMIGTLYLKDSYYLTERIDPVYARCGTIAASDKSEFKSCVLARQCAGLDNFC